MVGRVTTGTSRPSWVHYRLVVWPVGFVAFVVCIYIDRMNETETLS